MSAQDDPNLVDDPSMIDEEEKSGGGILAIALLALVVLLLIFLFREELGIGTPQAEISIPDRIEVDLPANAADNAS